MSLWAQLENFAQNYPADNLEQATCRACIWAFLREIKHKWKLQTIINP